MIEIADNFSLQQMVDIPTHGDNILDLFFTTNPDLMNNIRTSPGLSKHEAVIADYKLKANLYRKQPRQVYIFNKANKEKIREAILELKDNFIQACSLRSVEENWQAFKKQFINIVEKHVPTKITGKRIDLPWISIRVKKLMNKRKKKYDKVRKNNKPELWKSYRNHIEI